MRNPVVKQLLPVIAATLLVLPGCDKLCKKAEPAAQQPAAAPVQTQATEAQPTELTPAAPVQEVDATQQALQDQPK
jgi:hypothetical protein